jgi:hypothetical protein
MDHSHQAHRLSAVSMDDGRRPCSKVVRPDDAGQIAGVVARITESAIKAINDRPQILRLLDFRCDGRHPATGPIE